MAIAALSAGLLVISQTTSVGFLEDEAYNLNAAGLVNAGEKPYIDFFYQQMPLYLYLNAAWMRLFGETWRSSHILSALLTSGCGLIMAEYLYRRLRGGASGLLAATMAAVLFICNLVVSSAGCLSQGYGAGLFCCAAAFRLAVAGRLSRGMASFGSGLWAGAASGSSLLTAPLIPVLLLWTARTSPAGERWKRSMQYLAGIGIAFIPFLSLAFRGPRQTLFNVFEYHLFYRLAGFKEDFVDQNLRCILRLIDSPQGVLLILLAGVALLSMGGEKGWDERVKTEMRLCAWLAVSIGLYLSLLTPTFEGYFVLVMPFAGILVAVGATMLAGKLPAGRRRVLAITLVMALYFEPSARWLHGSMAPAANRWVYWEGIARQVGAVTPRDGLLYSDWDVVYFLEKRYCRPLAIDVRTESGWDAVYFMENCKSLSGLESPSSQDLLLPAGLASKLRALPRSQIDSWLSQGRFATVVMGAADPRIEKLGLRGIYAHMRMLDPEIAMLWRGQAPGE